MRTPRIDCSLFYPYAELRRHLGALARWKPAMANVRSLGKSRGGRDVLMIEVNDPTSGPAEDKPAYLVQGNVHAIEVSGSSSALYLAHYLLAHAGTDEATTELLGRVCFYIVPRVCVDGAEEALLHGRAPRSREEVERRRNCIWPEDLDGDGRILQMRIPDPNGSRVAFDDDPRLLLARLPADRGGRRYRVVTEGLIHDWDGGPWGDRVARHFDFNRNWGFNWKPPHEQGGAGRHAFSEPEVRAVGDFVFDHPNIFGMLGFHTGPQALLRPPSAGGDASIDRRDIGVFRELGRLGSDLTGFPLKAIHEYHGVFGTATDLWGHFPDWGYKALGLLAFEIELGTLWNSVGYTTEAIFGLTADTHRELDRRLMAWHDRHPDAGSFVPWKPFTHPQLGPVEIGGWVPVGWANVAPDDRVDVWERSRKFIFEHARRAPRLEIRDARAEPIAPGLVRVRCRVANEGYLPTSVTKLGAGVEGVEGVIVEVERTEGLGFVAGRNYTRLGHLGPSEYRELDWIVTVPAQRKPALTLIAHAARTGCVRTRVNLAHG